MNMLIDDLRIVVDKNKDKNNLFLRNLLKEQLQFYVLNFVYNSVYADKFLFKGGTALRFCFDLPRLSEDLDFDVFGFEGFNVDSFIDDVLFYFKKKIKYDDIFFKKSGNNKIIYFKFPILEKIGMKIDKNKPSENDLFLRVDLSSVVGKNFKTEISLKSTYDFSFIIKRYSVEDIFSGKIAAILTREKWEEKEKQPRFKGRDYFDIFWLKEKGVNFNFAYLKSLVNIKSKEELKKLLEKKFREAKKRKQELKQDLIPFFADQNFVEIFINNLDSFFDKFIKLENI